MPATFVGTSLTIGLTSSFLTISLVLEQEANMNTAIRQYITFFVEYFIVSFFSILKISNLNFNALKYLLTWGKYR